MRLVSSPRAGCVFSTSLSRFSVASFWHLCFVYLPRICPTSLSPDTLNFSAASPLSHFFPRRARRRRPELNPRSRACEAGGQPLDYWVSWQGGGHLRKARCDMQPGQFEALQSRTPRPPPALEAALATPCGLPGRSRIQDRPARSRRRRAIALGIQMSKRASVLPVHLIVGWRLPRAAMRTSKEALVLKKASADVGCRNLRRAHALAITRQLWRVGIPRCRGDSRYHCGSAVEPSCGANRFVAAGLKMSFSDTGGSATWARHAARSQRRPVCSTRWRQNSTCPAGAPSGAFEAAARSAGLYPTLLPASASR